MKYISVIFVMLLCIGSATATLKSTIISGTNINIELVNQKPDPALAGNILELRLSVLNTGTDPIDNVKIELEEIYPIIIPEGKSNTRVIPVLSAYQTGDNAQIIKFDVLLDKAASAGTYVLPLRYYTGTSDLFIRDEITIEISTSQQKLEIIDIDTTEIMPGEEKEIRFTIKNVGRTMLSDVTFEWTNSEKAVLPVGGDNSEYISSIDIGEVKEISFRIVSNTNVGSGLYLLDLKSTFEDNGVKTEKETQAGIYIGGNTDFEISLSSTAIGEYSFSIANIGSNPAYSVSVKVPEQEGWILTNKRADIIGNLNNGDYTIVSFELTPLNHALDLKLLIDYTNTRGNRISKEIIVPLGSSNVNGLGDNRTQNNAYIQRTGMNPDLSETERAAMRVARGGSAGGMAGGMVGMSNGFDKLKTYAVYAGFIVIVLIIVIAVFMNIKNKKVNKR